MADCMAWNSGQPSKPPEKLVNVPNHTGSRASDFGYYDNKHMTGNRTPSNHVPAYHDHSFARVDSRIEMANVGYHHSEPPRTPVPPPPRTPAADIRKVYNATDTQTVYRRPDSRMLAEKDIAHILNSREMTAEQIGSIMKHSGLSHGEVVQAVTKYAGDRKQRGGVKGLPPRPPPRETHRRYGEGDRRVHIAGADDFSNRSTYPRSKHQKTDNYRSMTGYYYDQDGNFVTTAPAEMRGNELTVKQPPRPSSGSRKILAPGKNSRVSHTRAWRPSSCKVAWPMTSDMGPDNPWQLARFRGPAKPRVDSGRKREADAASNGRSTPGNVSVKMSCPDRSDMTLNVRVHTSRDSTIRPMSSDYIY